MTDEPRTPAAKGPEEGLPPLPVRLFQVVVSPGRLMDRLADEPRWIGALLVAAALVATTVSLIPIELFMEANREAAIERGAEFPEMTEGALRAMRLVIPLGTVISTLLLTAFFASVYTVLFAFVLGDEGRFAQYLAVVSHAYFIPVLSGLLITPLRIVTGDPQLTLNVATFGAAILPEGYILDVLRVFDLTQIWATLVIAQGVHAIDRRRSFGSAAAILFCVFTLMALVLGRLMG